MTAASSSISPRFAAREEAAGRGAVLSDAQQEYAASDVRYLHAMHAIFVERLAREGRTELAQACFDFLPMRARLDLAGWAEKDIFSHE